MGMFDEHGLREPTPEEAWKFLDHAVGALRMTLRESANHSQYLTKLEEQKEFIRSQHEGESKNDSPIKLVTLFLTDIRDAEMSAEQRAYMVIACWELEGERQFDEDE